MPKVSEKHRRFSSQTASFDLSIHNNFEIIRTFKQVYAIHMFYRT